MVRECCGGRHKSQETAQPSSGSRKYIPSEDIGDYEEYRSKGSRRKSSGPPGGILFPLDEEGSYGGPPRAPPKPLPGYQKRDRKPKVYASYAVSNDCSMHADKLEKNETRGMSPPKRRSSNRESVGRRDSVNGRRDSDSVRRESEGRRESKSRTPTRSSVGRSSSFRSTGGQQPNREQDTYQQKPQRWQDSLRGRDSQSPLPVRRPSATLPRTRTRTTSSSVSPTRTRNLSSSSDRMRKQSTSPERGRNSSADYGPKTSTDWGYTDFNTFRARNSMSGVSGGSSNTRSTSLVGTASKNSLSGTASSYGSRKTSAPLTERNSSYTTSSSSANYSTSSGSKTMRTYSSTNTEYSSSRNKSYTSDYSSDYSVGDKTTPMRSSSSRSSSPSKIGLSILKTPTITEWDQMGVLGLSSKMFSHSSTIKESSESYPLRRESVTSKMM